MGRGRGRGFTNYDIRAKQFRKNNWDWDRAPQSGKNSKEKKKIGEPSELSSSLGTREKGLFMPFYAFKKLDSLKAYGEFTGLPTIRPTSTTRGGGGGTRPLLG